MIINTNQTPLIIQILLSNIKPFITIFKFSYQFNFILLYFHIDNMDSAEENAVPARRTHRLTLDSEEEERKEQERRREEQEYERQRQERRRRKEEKRKIREEQERQAEQKAKEQHERQMKEIQKYNDPAKLLQMDSDSSVGFKRIANKIKVMYPQHYKKHRRYQSSESQDQDSEEESSQEEQSESRKPKKTKKISKRRHDDDSPPQKKPKVKQTVKTQHQLTRKEALVLQVARRWWYAFPEWPPTDFPYEQQLKKQGYRVVKTSQFRLADEVKDGLVKTTQLQGYKGVYRSKHKLIDVRPKQKCPSINFFTTLNEEHLTDLLKTALIAQIKELKAVEFKQSGDRELIVDLEKQLAQIK